MQQLEDVPEVFHTLNLTELNTWRWRVPGSQSCCPRNWRKGKKYHGRGTTAGKGSEVPGRLSAICQKNFRNLYGVNNLLK